MDWIYFWFAIWLLLIIFAGSGVYSLLSRLANPAIINWVLLPGTIISEMAYIFGCLITGGEIKKAKLMPDGGAKGEGGSAATEASPKLKFIGPAVAALMAIVVCGGAILAAQSLLGAPVVTQFNNQQNSAALPPMYSAASFHKKATPESFHGYVNATWDQLHHQATLLRKTTDTLSELKWSDWRVPLFLYLAACLAIRLSPAKRPLRPTLAAAVFISLIIGVIGALTDSKLMYDLWPLLTFIYSITLLMLVITLAVCGLVTLAKALLGKGAGSAAPAKAGAK